MTSKNSFWKFSIWNLKKRTWTFALCGVIWFFALVVPMFMETQRIVAGLAGYTGTDIAWQQQMLINTFMSGGGGHAALAIALAIFLGVQGFSWNNHQQKVDMYKSVPIKAAARFWYINGNSLLIFTVTYGCGLILANAIAGFSGLWCSAFLYAALYSFFIHMLLFIAVYFVVVIAQHLTGNVILAVMGSAILIFIEAACQLMIEGFKNIFFDTYTGSRSYVVVENGIISPFGPFLKAYKTVSMQERGFADVTGYADAWLPILLLIVHIVIYGSVAYVLYQKRPAQTGGKTIIFNKTKPIIKGVLLVVGSLYFGGLMMVIGGYDTLGYGIFGIACGLVIFHAILQSIMNGGFKEIFKGKIGLLVSAVIAFGIYFGFAFDITGYDTYLPDADEVESYAFIRSNDWVYDIYNDTGEYVSTEDYLMDQMAISDTASKEALLNMIGTAMEENDYRFWDHDTWGYGIEEVTQEVSLYPTYEDGNTQERVTVVYRLKNGQTKERSYVLRVEDVRNFWTMYYDLPQYKELIHSIYREGVKKAMENEEYRTCLSYHAYGTAQSDANTWTEEVYMPMYEAVCEDLMTRSAEVVLNESPQNCIRIDIEDKNRTLYHLSIPVYESDVQTIALLKEYGWYQEAGIRPEDVLTLAVTQEYEVDNEYGYEYKVLDVPLDAGYFEKAVDALILIEASDYVADSGAYLKNGYYADVNVQIDGMTYSYSCYFDRNKFPQELEDAFADVIPESEKNPDMYY